ncbi:MAG: EAL domain-containing protein, partial [Rhodocyclaceae bacterium]|nr:EAL domain-containing protein [Rhodocyclaceae bacterium]
QVTLAATKLLRQFDSPFTLHTREYRLVAYVGAVCAPDQANSVDDLLMFVRLSSFEARTRGSRLELFRDELNRASAHHFEIERELSQALENEQIELHLQPQIDAATGYCLGAEALLRWNNSARVAVPPQLVIEAADRAGLSAQLTRWVIVSACRMLAQLTQEDPSFNLSVNITANDLKDAELPDLLQQALTTFGVPAHCLTLELTENAMITDEQRCLEIMARLRQMRLRLSIDDFGTGYSSMVYLRRMPVQELKIDKVFVQRLAQYGRDREIVRSLVGLGHGLGLEVVAEGVEDGGVLDLLRSYGCDRMQGFHISPPLPRAQFIEWWRQGRRKPIGEY